MMKFNFMLQILENVSLIFKNLYRSKIDDETIIVLKHIYIHLKNMGKSSEKVSLNNKL